MDFSGERIIPGEAGLGPVVVEHLARYEWARQFAKGKRVLDAPCGAGYGSALLAEGDAVSVVGIDIDPEAIEYAVGQYQLENVTFQVMDCYDLAFDEESFDTVCSFEGIEHLAKPEQFVQQIAKVLSTGGTLIVSTPNKRLSSPGRKHPVNPYHLVEFYLRDFVSLLDKYFTTVEIWGQTLPKYDSTLAQRAWNRFPRIKGLIPWGLIVQGLKIANRGKDQSYTIEDVYFSQIEPEKAKVFVAVCRK